MKHMKNDQNLNMTPDNTSDPHIYSSKSQNSTSNTLNTSNILKSSKIPHKIQPSIKKILQNPKFSLFLLIFFILNLIFSVLTITTTLSTHKENKQLKSDNVTIYEMFDVLNVTRIAKARQIKYLESLLDENNIYITPLYSVYIQEEMYEEYKDTIEKFHKIDYNEVLDQYLNEDYNTMLYEIRIKELESREKLSDN